MAPKCPVCGKPMLMIYGDYWDYDRWVCMVRDPQTLRLCPGEIELETSTELPEELRDE